MLEQAGLTIVGFSHGANISLNHARTIKNGKASISSKTAGKIADFFCIEAGLLFLPKAIKIKDPLNIPTIQKFYDENIQNDKFFTVKAKENSVTAILKEKIIYESLMDDWTRSKEIVTYVNETKKYKKYNNIFNIRSVSKALGRIYAESNLLERADLRENGKVFIYKRKQ
ncbi:hypothetical protein [Mucilaginibacter paludis]|nr:hypothetical protein [Mucilaginibacter paludis]